MNNNLLKIDLKNLFKKNEFDQFEVKALKFLKDCKDTEILTLLSEVYIHKKKFKSAREVILNIINIEDSSVNSLLNLGRLYFIANKLDDSVKVYSEVAKIDKFSIAALEGLSLCFMALKEFDRAVLNLKKIISIDKKNNRAYQLLGEIFMILENYPESLKYYKLSKLDEGRAKYLECLYLLNKDNEFKKELSFFIKNKKYYPLVASLSNHYSYKYSTENEYPFCSKPLEFIYEKNLYEINNFNDDYIKKILEDFNSTVITRREQNLLSGGFQSGGNFFDINLKDINNLKKIISKEIENYKKFFIKTNDPLITEFPKKYNLSGWIIRMKENDYLKSHIHEKGWISGSIYLNTVDKPKGNEGAIKFSISGGKLKNNFKSPYKINKIRKGSLILFPSSLYHSTVPFENSDDERITLAFDVKPNFS